MNENTEKYEVLGIEVEVKKGVSLEIEAVFAPFHNGVVALYDEYTEIKDVKDITPELAKKAGVLRKKFAKQRTGCEKARKEAKSDVLKLGRAYDAIGNKIKNYTTEKELVLSKIEKHAEIAEKKRLEALKEERVKTLFEECKIDGNSLSLENMEDPIWEAFLLGQKTKVENDRKEKRVAFLAKLETDRVAKEKQQALDNENKRLKEENRIIEAKAKAEREEIARLANIEADKQAEILRVEKEKSAKLKADIEAKAKAEREEKEKKEAEDLERKQAPDKKKLTHWLFSFNLTPPDFSDERFSCIAMQFIEQVQKSMTDAESKI